jgi:cyclophilin family peptidyl-prolyl cis-trans isomerase
MTLALAVSTVICLVQQPLTFGAEAGMVSARLRPAEPATYPGQDVIINLVFVNSAEVPGEVARRAFSREAFTIVDPKGRPPKKSSVSGAAVEPLTLDAYGTVERRVNLSAWYPELSARKQAWTITWKDSGLEAGPLKFVVTEPYDPEKDRTAVLETDIGTMTWDLLPDHAPRHVKHFVDLARQGFYDGLTIFRAVPGVQVEGGDPKGDGTGGWESLQMPEISSSLKMEAGLVGASRRAGPTPSTMTSDSIFFVAMAVPTFMRGTNTFFAQLTEGWDVLAKLIRSPSRGETGADDAFNLATPVKINRVTIKR